MFNRDKNNGVRIQGNNQQTIAISATAVKSTPLPSGVYDLWSNVACYISVNASRNGNGSAATIPDVTTVNGYYIPANKTIPVQIQDGDVIGIIGTGSGNFKLMKTGENVTQQRTETIYIPPAPVQTAPAAFTAGQWSITDAATGGTATVTISALPSNGGSAITAIQYQVGAGAWTASGISSTGTFNITGLTNGASVNVKVRAVNAIGEGDESLPKPVEPSAGSALTNIAPVTDWRLPITDAQSSQTAFNSALIASSGNKDWPATSSVASGGTLVVPFKIGAVAAPGGMLNYHWSTNNGSYTIVAEQSFDSTNGTDGTWETIASPAYQATGLSAANKGQIVRLVTGAARWIRLTFTVSTASGILRLKAHQLASVGRNFIIGVIGASKESLGLLTLDFWNEIKAQFASADPIILDYSNGGILGPAITANLAKLYSDVPEVVYPYTGQYGGNDVTANRPYASVSQGTRDTIAANYTNYLNSSVSSGKYPFPVDLDYRNYNTTNPVNGTANQENGSKPFNENIYGPIIQTVMAEYFDTERAVPRMHPYSLQVQKPWFVSSDGIHETAIGFNVLRREIVRNWIGRILNTAWPAKPAETNLVEKAETTLAYRDKLAALNAINALPASTYKTSMLARLNALTPPTDVAEISFSSSATVVTPNWNRLQNAHVSGVALASIVDVTGAAIAGMSLATTTAGTASASSGGYTTGYDDANVPDEILDSHVRADTGATLTIELTVPGTSYRVDAISSFGGTYTTRNAAITVNGVTVNANPSNNVTPSTWVTVTPVGGKITVTVTPQSGSSRAYLNMLRLTRLS